MRPRGPWEEEGPPVRDSSDHTRGAQDYGTCVAGDSGREMLVVSDGVFGEGGRSCIEWVVVILFGFIDVAGSDLYR